MTCLFRTYFFDGFERQWELKIHQSHLLSNRLKNRVAILGKENVKMVKRVLTVIKAKGTLSCSFAKVGEVFYCYADEEEIKLSRTAPATEEEFFSVECQIYGERCSVLTLPLKHQSMFFGEYIAVVEEKYGFSLRKATKEEIKNYAQKPREIPKRSGTVRAFRYFYLTAKEKEALNIHSGDDLIVTMNVTDKTCLEVKKASTPSEHAMETMREQLKRMGREMFFSKPRTYRVKMHDAFILPSKFIQQAKIDKRDCRLLTKRKGQSFFIGSTRIKCDLCGKLLDPFSENVYYGVCCSDCGQLVKERDTAEIA